jgi:fructose-1,6-bisphosphatase/inositol monophosphatase family enzyme
VTIVDMEAVGALLRQATATAIVPRFGRLASADVEEKAPGEVVTVADREAEAIIRQGLEDLLPNVPVIGEEAVAADPALLDAIRTERRVWLVDPLDGTSNFIAGIPHWAAEIALVEAGETVQSWMLRADGVMFVAARGAGAWRDGRQLRATVGEFPAPASLRGAVLTRFLTEDERARMLPLLPAFGDITAGFKCTAFEYPAIIEGEEDFALFQRLLPWDHAPGCLLLTEAGGMVAHPDGTPFRPDHANRRGLLLARDPQTWTTVRDLLYPALAGAGVA